MVVMVVMMTMTSTDKMRTRPVVSVVGFVQVMRRGGMRMGQIAGAIRMRMRGGGGASDHGVRGDGPATQARSLDGR